MRPLEACVSRSQLKHAPSHPKPLPRSIPPSLYTTGSPRDRRALTPNPQAAANFTEADLTIQWPGSFATGGSDASIGAGAFAARLAGTFRAPVTAGCTFALSAGALGASRLSVDGALVAIASSSTAGAASASQPPACHPTMAGISAAYYHATAGGDCSALKDSGGYDTLEDAYHYVRAFKTYGHNCNGITLDRNGKYTPRKWPKVYYSWRDETSWILDDKCLGQPAVSAQSGPAPVVHTVSLTGGQTYAFELLHFEASAETGLGPRSVDVRLSCPGVPSSSSYGNTLPADVTDISARRLSLGLQPWPRHSRPLGNAAPSSAVSRAVSLVAGERYYLHLTCASGERAFGTCGVGARALTAVASMATSPSIMRWRARVRRDDKMLAEAAKCSEIKDKEQCCAAVDRDGDVCVPAVTTFADGTVCQGWAQTLRHQPKGGRNAVAACPAHEDMTTRASRARVKLPSGVGCEDVTSRVACCSALDGGSSRGMEDAPCVPAVTRFFNGAVCEAAQYVASFGQSGGFATGGSSEASASCAELTMVSPKVSALGEEAAVTHDVQRLTISQIAPKKHTVRLTFTSAR